MVCACLNAATAAISSVYFRMAPPKTFPLMFASVGIIILREVETEWETGLPTGALLGIVLRERGEIDKHSLELRTSMEYLTPEEMRAAEAAAGSRGLDTEKLMENAGKAIAGVIDQRYASRRGGRILVVCGLGNKGGDGMVAARYLKKEWSVLVILLGGPGLIKTQEALRNWTRIESRVVSIGEAEGLKRHKRYFERADIILDAILGTGMRGEVRDPFATAVDMINAAKAVKVSVDIPSGLDPLTGEPSTRVVRADLTVTLHRAKAGMRGREEYTGEVVVADIGMDG